MGSYVLCRELENLDNDAESRKSALKTLKSLVKDLDSKAIPLFLAQVSATKEQGSYAREYSISLYEVLARVHGRHIVPHIESIMSTIVKTLSSSVGSFPLQQACSKVVPTIARYAIEPTTPHDEKSRIIMSLYKPLADVLMSLSETLSSGAALCLEALVKSDNWRFASSDVVNELCLKVASALEEKSCQTNAHMSLAMELSKHNSMTVEAYARSLLRSGLQILEVGTEERNSQKRFSAIQMINFLMKFVDSRSISSELANVVEVMEKYEDDPMPYIAGAAFESLQTAKLILLQLGLRYEQPSSPYVGSNFVGVYPERDIDDSPPELVSSDSPTLDSSVESSLSTGQTSCNLGPGKRMSRLIWKNDDRLDVSLKNGQFRDSTSGNNGLGSYIGQSDDAHRNGTATGHSGPFSGYEESNANLLNQEDSTLRSLRRPCSPVSMHNSTMFSNRHVSPRSLRCETDRCCTDCHIRDARTPTPTPQHLELNPKTEVDEIHGNGQGESSEMVSANLSNGDLQIELTAQEVLCENCSVAIGRARRKMTVCSKAMLSLVMSISLALPAVVAFMWIDYDQSSLGMVPT